MTSMINEDEESQQIIMFKLDDKLYGVNIGQIREITRISEISPVPNAPSYIEGVTNLRGQVTTVVNLRKKLAMPHKEFDKESRMMIIESGGRSVGIIVDSVTEVTMVSKADIEETPELARTAQVKSSYLKGIAKKDSRLIILVDLLDLLEWDNLPEYVAQTATPKVEQPMAKAVS
jgi:purine-binding chemotaxis protein CheW